MARRLARFLAMSAQRVAMPRWGRITLGLLCVIVGVVLTFKPFTSIGALAALVALTAFVTGLADLCTADLAAAPDPQRVIGVLWIFAGLLVVGWPGLGVRGIALFVGVMLAAAGLTRVLAGVLGTQDQRLTAIVGGLAAIGCGVLALAWPHVTPLVVAVAFGARTVLFGLSVVVDDLHLRGDDAPETIAGQPWWQRDVRTVGAVSAVVVAVGLAGISASVREGKPTVDQFYTAPSQASPIPGSLLRTARLHKGIPSDADAWRILYTTTDNAGHGTIASAIVVVGKTGKDHSKAEPARPVLAWEHGATGVATGCAPSAGDRPFAALPGLSQIVDRGWVVVAPDYEGLGTAGLSSYLVGPAQAYATLDAVRAARRMSQFTLATQTAIWGYGQGGNAALWTGQLVGSYAPDVPVDAVAAIAPTADLSAFATTLGTAPGGVVAASYLASSYAANYADVRSSTVVPAGAQATVRGYAGRCLPAQEDYAELSSAASTVFAASSGASVLAKHLTDNTPAAAIPAPTYIAQGSTDALVPTAVQDAYVAKRCTLGGGPLFYKKYPGSDHLGIVRDGSPVTADLLAWTIERFAGKPAPTTC